MAVYRSDPFIVSILDRVSRKWKRAAYELSRETFGGEGTDYITMYDGEGTMLGKLAFTIKGDEIMVQSLTVDDWSESSATMERLIRFIERIARRRKAAVVKAELYVSDARSTEKIERMKAFGWVPMDVGRMGQRTSYTLQKKF